MNKLNNVKLLNNTASVSNGVLLSRQTIGSGTTSDECGADRFLLINITRLMTTIKFGLTTYIEYLAGDLEQLPKNINNTMLQSLSSSFYVLRQPTLIGSVYEKYRLLAISLIPVFKNVSTQVSSCQNIKSQLDAALAKAAILDNMSLLQDYIEGLKKNYNVIPDQNIYVPKASIKEPYNTYIEYFGFPEGMLWDPDRLSFVVDYLKKKNLM
jgi:hypothetical protein